MSKLRICQDSNQQEVIQSQQGPGMAMMLQCSTMREFSKHGEFEETTRISLHATNSI